MDFRKPDVVTVAVKQAGGGLTVMRVVVNQYAPNADNTDRVLISHTEPTEERVEALIAKYVADGHWAGDKAPAGWRFVPNEFLDDTTDLTFRDAWKDDGKDKPGHDMAKAREIHKERMREKRANLLEDLDKEYMRADEAGDTKKKKEIADKKQALRDVTDDPKIEKAKTPEALKAVWPEILQ